MYNAIISNIVYFLWFFSWNYYSSNITNILQNWGDYTDMSQAVIIYVSYASDVLLICWCGTQLTQQVRKDGLLLLLLLALLAHYIHNVYWASNQLRNNGPNSALSVLVPYPAYNIQFYRKNVKRGFKESDNLRIFPTVSLRPNAGHGLLFIEVYRSHKTTHHGR